MARSPAGPARGVLRRAVPDGEMVHQRLLPAASLAAYVAHGWWVAWELRRPFVTETLPHPSVHLIFEARAEVAGVQTRRFVRKLAGRGRVLGIKFRPATFASFAGRSPSTLRDRHLPIARVLGQRGARLARALRQVATLDEGMAIVEEMLTVPPLPQEVAELRDLVERMEHDRELLRVEEAAKCLGVTVRTLERRFREHVGVSPKWVIRRYRLIEAAEQLHRHPRSLAALAAQLGYSDQSHFVRDWKALVGAPPSAYTRP